LSNEKSWTYSIDCSDGTIAGRCLCAQTGPGACASSSTGART